MITNLTNPGQAPAEGDQIEKRDGNLTIKYTQGPLVTATEVAKEWRNSELSNSDWIIQTSDHPQRAAYITYRTALRDWPTASDFPTTRADLNAAAKAASLAEGGAGALANATTVAEYHTNEATTAGEDSAVDAIANETGVVAGETQAVAEGVAAGETQAVADGIAAEVGANQPKLGS